MSKKIGIPQPVQLKFGSWIGAVVDTEAKQVLYEHMDYSKQSCFISCLWWAMQLGDDITVVEPKE